MNIRKSLASIAAGSLALAGIAVVAAPAAQATTTTFTYDANTNTGNPLLCWVTNTNSATPGDYSNPGAPVGYVSTSRARWPNGEDDGVTIHGSVSHDLVVPASVSQGSPVTVTYNYSEGPKNGPSAVVGERAVVTYEITNGAAVTTFTGQPSAPFDVAGASFPGPIPGGITDIIPGSAFPTSGAATIKVKYIDFVATPITGLPGNGVVTRCNAQNGATPTNGVYNPASPGTNPFSVPVTTAVTTGTTVTGASMAFTDASQNVAGYARAENPGPTGPNASDTLTITGSSWDASVTAQVAGSSGRAASTNLPADTSFIPAAQTTYSGITTSTVTGSGSGLVLNVRRAATTGAINQVTVASSGSGYAVGDTVSILAGTTGATSGSVTFTIATIVKAPSFSAQLCDSTGANCENVRGAVRGSTAGTDAATNNIVLSTDASGNVTGTIKLQREDAAGPAIQYFTTGDRTLKISNGVKSAAVPVTVLGTATVTFSPANPFAGDSVTVSGSNWNPSTKHAAFAAKANNFTGGPVSGFSCPIATNPGSVVCGPYVPVDAPGGALPSLAGGGSPSALSPGTSTDFTTTATGAIPTGITIAVPANSVYIEVAQLSGPSVTWPSLATGGQSKVTGSDAVNPSSPIVFATASDNCIAATGNANGTSTPSANPCKTTQQITATVNPGNLRQQVVSAGGLNTSTTIPLADSTTSISGTTLNGTLNPITVTDERGGVVGWSLTAALKDASFGKTGDATKSIPNTAFSLTGMACQITATGAGLSAAIGTSPAAAQGITAPSNGTQAGAFTLCGVSPNTVGPAGSGGGQYVVSGGVRLAVPAFQAVGTYSNTLVVTLV